MCCCMQQPVRHMAWPAGCTTAELRPGRQRSSADTSSADVTCGAPLPLPCSAGRPPRPAQWCSRRRCAALRPPHPCPPPLSRPRPLLPTTCRRQLWSTRHPRHTIHLRRRPRCMRHRRPVSKHPAARAGDWWFRHAALSLAVAACPVHGAGCALADPCFASVRQQLPRHNHLADGVVVPSPSPYFVPTTPIPTPIPNPIPGECGAPLLCFNTVCFAATAQGKHCSNGGQPVHAHSAVSQLQLAAYPGTSSRHQPGPCHPPWAVHRFRLQGCRQAPSSPAPAPASSWRLPVHRRPMPSGCHQQRSLPGRCPQWQSRPLHVRCVGGWVEGSQCCAVARLFAGLNQPAHVCAVLSCRQAPDGLNQCFLVIPILFLVSVQKLPLLPLSPFCSRAPASRDPHLHGRVSAVLLCAACLFSLAAVTNMVCCMVRCFHGARGAHCSVAAACGRAAATHH